ncbi:MAG: putative ATP-dependent DNA helicase recG C-terminal [Candidatus Nitrotoga sp. MKT]|nr:MAG: putative ATP-dependent DNA helicase recG C-terminal [Candidatus Nitrotoga sp. MKT]
MLSKINLAVGTRALSAQAPVAYEIPPEVISEAIVNAIAHRDYTSNASVQVMLFADRLEVWNPGNLPPALTLKTLCEPHGSYPANPLIAEPMYLTKYIERMGTGIGDMIERCIAHGLREPEFKLTDGFVTTIWRKPELAFSHVGGETGEVTQQLTQQLTQ